VLYAATLVGAMKHSRLLCSTFVIREPLLTLTICLYLVYYMMFFSG